MLVEQSNSHIRVLDNRQYSYSREQLEAKVIPFGMNP